MAQINPTQTEGYFYSTENSEEPFLKQSTIITATFTVTNGEERI